ncbi:MAG: hypothetical protein HQK61_12585 [Desulfamplus sp.]|nr:hypothetical protein [Desulfamplus sp.]
MTQKIQNMLKKITYIEADIEIQKQILFSIPSEKTDEMEQVMTGIAEKKDMINNLRDQIKEADPLEFDRIIRFENAAIEFKKIAAEKKFSEVFTLSSVDACVVSLKNGKKIDCLVKARDLKGDWAAITVDGEILHISKSDIKL